MTRVVNDENRPPTSGPDAGDFSLFHGPHLPAFRFARALERLDLAAAANDAPEPWKPAVEEMAAVLARAGSVTRLDLEALARCRRRGWPPVIEQAWQRLVGLHLDGHGIPGMYHGELAAAFLGRGGDLDRAHSSIRRHLQHHPRDADGWEILAAYEPLRGAVRSGFHGGPLLDAAGDLIDLVREDELEPVAPWLLSYAWFGRHIALDEIRDALAAEHMLERPPLPVPGDARAFAWYVLDAGGRRYVGESVGVIEARQRLQRISPAAFRRYLARM
jgi:hypothetical protein